MCRVGWFPVNKRPQFYKLSFKSQQVINKWFNKSRITIGIIADTIEKIQMIQRMLFTWKNCFARNLKEIRATNLIQHTIDLKLNARLIYSKIPQYNCKKRQFAAKIFSKMEKTRIITKATSNWEACSKFPPKKKGSDNLHMVHNFIPVNNMTQKLQYPMHQMEEVIEIVIKPKFKVFFGADAANRYCTIPMKLGHKYKTEIVMLYGQYVYLQISQELKGALHTYAQYLDLTFKHLSSNNERTNKHKLLIGDHGNCQNSCIYYSKSGNGPCSTIQELTDQ